MNNRKDPNLADSIKDMVQNTLDSIDFDSINKNINNTVNATMERVRREVSNAGRTAMNEFEKMNYNNHMFGNYNQNQQYQGNHYSNSAGNYNQKAAQWNMYQQPNQPQTSTQRKENTARPAVRNIKGYPCHLVTRNPAGSASGIIYKIFGYSGATAALICSIVFASLFFSGAWHGAVVGLCIAFPIFVGFGLLAKRGTTLRRRVSRFRKYVSVLDGRSFCQLEEFADSIGESVKYVEKDIYKMIQMHMFPQGHVDRENENFILDNETYRQYQEIKAKASMVETQDKNEEIKDQEMDEAQRIAKAGQLYVQQMQELNKEIRNPAVSEKIQRLQMVSSKIYEYVAKHPEKLDEIRKFMDYYMPTTLKLICAYKEFEAQSIEGDNIKGTKEEIEQTLDTIYQAFENLFDSLFEEEAMDISTDISVLQTMLKQEGLTEKDFKAEKEK